MVIVERDFTRFANSLQSNMSAQLARSVFSPIVCPCSHLQCSEMYDAVDIRVFREDLVKPLLVRDIPIVVLRLLAADKLYPVEDFDGGVVEIIYDDHFVSGFQ